MPKEAPKRMLQTVTGPLDPDALGITLVHEHILNDGSVFFEEPAAASDRYWAHQPLSLQSLHWVRYHPCSNLDNCGLRDEALMRTEVDRFKAAGGGVLVEVSTIGLGRDPQGVARISRATGVPVVMGTGTYIDASLPDWVRSLSEDALAELFIGEIRDGIAGTGVKAGIIGEMGCSAPLTETEIRALRAAGMAQSETGAAIDIHPSHAGVDPALALENARLCHEGGAEYGSIVVGHVDCMRFPEAIIQKLLDTGCVVAYDTFGCYESYWSPYFGTPQYMPCDYERATALKNWCDKGYVSQLLISSDHSYKVHLAAFGGCGYDHVIRNVMPLLKTVGVTDAQINAMLIDNPRRLLPVRG
ncbi:MAG: hypothetical protein JXR37_28555 [Kiritimatiellae bacterium]|nr:hypothetical protein [Kiritimatiellia bacterium]